MASSESQPTIDTKSPQIAQDVLTDLNLTQADIDSHYKNKEQLTNADAALNKGDWKTAITIHDQIQDGGIGGPNAHDIRLKIAEMFKDNPDTRREVAEHIQSLIEAKVATSPKTPEPIPAPEPAPIDTNQQTTVGAPPTIDSPLPSNEPVQVIPPVTTLPPISAEPAPIVNKVVSFPHLAQSRTNPTVPEPTPILNISGEVNLNPTQQTTESSGLRAAPPNPLAA